MSAGRTELAGRPVSDPTGLHPAFRSNSYLVRKQFFKLFGKSFHIYDGAGNLLLYSKELPFRFRDDFRVFADESETDELLNVRTPQFFEFGAVFNVEDSHRGEAVGAVQRRGFRSIIRDEWLFLSVAGQEIGRLVEADSSALMSRFFTSWIPQHYDIVAWDGRKLAEIQQVFNPFILKYTVNILDPEPLIDRRLLLAAGLLLAGVEGRQEELVSVGGMGAGGLLAGSQADDQGDVISTASIEAGVEDSSAAGDLFDLGSAMFDDKA